MTLLPAEIFFSKALIHSNLAFKKENQAKIGLF